MQFPPFKVYDSLGSHRVVQSWLQSTLDYCITAERNPVPISSRSHLYSSPSHPQPWGSHFLPLSLPALDLSYKGHRPTGGLCDQLLLLSVVFSRLFRVAYVSTDSFLLPNKDPLYGIIMLCFSVHQSLDIWLVFIFWLLRHREELLRSFHLNRISSIRKQWFGEAMIPQRLQSYSMWDNLTGTQACWFCLLSTIVSR